MKRPTLQITPPQRPCSQCGARDRWRQGLVSGGAWACGACFGRPVYADEGDAAAFMRELVGGWAEAGRTPA